MPGTVRILQAAHAADPGKAGDHRLKQGYTGVGTGFHHVLRPDGALDLSDVNLGKQRHAQSRLSDSAADRERKLSVKQRTVEPVSYTHLTLPTIATV